jgi:hypothetical protein
MIIDDLLYALSKLDWKYVTPSRFDYGDGEPKVAAQIWHERMFAYEIYHQLRVLWTEQPERGSYCVIHAEVRKGYQHIANFDYMPDFLFHLPEPGKNLAVVEVKLAVRPLAKIQADLNKLVLFHGKPLKYETIVGILIGSDAHFDPVVRKISSKDGTPIHILYLSTDTKQTKYLIIK